MLYDSIKYYVDEDYRLILVADILINRNTPRGEPATIYERMPYEGRRSFRPVGGVTESGVFRIANCLMTVERRRRILAFLRREGFKKDPGHIWHDGRLLRTGLLNWKPSS